MLALLGLSTRLQQWGDLEAQHVVAADHSLTSSTGLGVGGRPSEATLAGNAVASVVPGTRVALLAHPCSNGSLPWAVGGARTMDGR